MAEPIPPSLAREVVADLPNPVVAVDRESRVRHLNPAAARCFGWQPEEVAGHPLERILPVAPETLGLAGGDPVDGAGLPLTLRAQSRTGSPFLIRLAALVREELTALILDRPEPVRHANHDRDRLLGQALDQLGDMVWITDRQGLIQYINPAFERVTGYTREEVLGQDTGGILRSGHHDGGFYERLWAALRAGRSYRNVLTNRTRSGELVYLDETITPVVTEADGSAGFYVATARDITHRLALEDRLQEMAFYDPLTGLANRDLVVNRTERAIARARRDERAVALLALDLRQFRNINQSLGHGVGDQVLQAVGDRLRESVAEGDTVGRVGSDRFLLLLEGLAQGNEARRVVERLLDRLRDPLEAAGQRFFLGAWCGLATYPEDGGGAAVLLGHAETALGRARSERIKGPVFYSPKRDHQAQQRHDLETELHRALDSDQLHLHYQPQYRLSDGALVGVEALVRWHHPRLGPVSPAEFVPLLEETGLIHPVGEWILRTAAAQAVQWDEAGLSHLGIGVNLSPEQFRHPGLVARIQGALEESGLPEERLELEITESLLIEDPPDVLKNLQILRGMGMAVALDDFGTGYSALSYLQDFPIDVLKLDRSLIDGLERHLERSPGLIRGVIDLAQGLAMGVVAEGVETEAQLRFLRSVACDRGQGFGLARPQPPEAIPALAGEPPPGGVL